MSERESKKRDWRVSVVLIAVWSVTITVILTRGTDIPISMILLASAFFVFLLPAMQDLVIIIEKKIGGGSQSPNSAEENSNER